MKKTLIIVILLIINFSCNSQKVTKEFPINIFEINSIFAEKISDKKLNKENAYCLLGQGFFKTKRSSNSDKLLNEWLSKHPKAKLIVVSELIDQENNSILSYCWIVDGNENLNIYLVKNGCFPGGTMQRPPKWKEMNSKLKKMYRKNGIPKPNVEVFIEDKEYQEFLNKIIEAEKYAMNNKLGIWK